MVYSDLLSTFNGAKSILSSIAGLTYEDVIQSKSSYKNALLEAGIGFDGHINYNICFDAKFDTDTRGGSMFFKVNGLYDRIADYDLNILNKDAPSSSDTKFRMIFTKEWNVDVTRPLIHSVDTIALADKFAAFDGGAYDPLYACSGFVNSPVCTDLGPDGSTAIGEFFAAGANLGTYNVQATGQMPAPQLRDYYFKTSPNTWASACVFDESAIDNVSCAKFVPVDCTTKQEIAFAPIIEDKILQVAALNTTKSNKIQNLLNVLTLGATGPLFQGLSDAESSSDVKQAMLSLLNGHFDSNLLSKIDPAMLNIESLNNLVTLINLENKLKIPDLADPVGSVTNLLSKDVMALQTLLKGSSGLDVMGLANLLNILKVTKSTPQ